MREILKIRFKVHFDEEEHLSDLSPIEFNVTYYYVGTRCCKRSTLAMTEIW